MADRRAFLRGLAALPLIGGSVSLIGNPTGAAVPVTGPLLDRYVDWLATEYGNALIEQDGREARPEFADYAIDYRRRWCCDNRTLNPDPTSERFSLLPMTAPSTRAAVVMAAAGVDLLGGRRA